MEVFEFVTEVTFGIVVFCLVVWPIITYIQDGVRAVNRKLHERSDA